MEINFELEIECPLCHGGGRIYNQDDPDAALVWCDRCWGMGAVPSREGDELLAFFTRYTVGLEERKRLAESENAERSRAVALKPKPTKNLSNHPHDPKHP